MSFSSHEEQAALYKKYLAHKDAMYAVPGVNKHWTYTDELASKPVMPWATASASEIIKDIIETKKMWKKPFSSSESWHYDYKGYEPTYFWVDEPVAWKKEEEETEAIDASEYLKRMMQ